MRVPFTVEPNYAGWRLDRYLQEKIRRLSRERIQRLIETRIEHDGPSRLKPATRVTAGMRFAILKDADPEPETPMVFGVIFDDARLLVVDKPAGLPVHPTARYAEHTFTALARAAYPARKVDPAHRLDRETSGLMACGCAPKFTRALKASFAAGRVDEGLPGARAGRPRPGPLRGRGAALPHRGERGEGADARRRRAGCPRAPASRSWGGAGPADGAPVALVACHPRTGRQHQIRAHLHHAGLHLVGDKIYGPDEMIFDRFTKRELSEADHAILRLPRQALHAWRLSLPHPETGERVELEAPLAPDLQAFWDGCTRR